MNPTQWVDVGGAMLAAEFTQGAPAQARPLVWLHAGVADSRMWQAQAQAFGPEHPQLRYDRRGFGQSRIQGAVPHAHLADLWAVMDSAGVDRAVLIGCSQGGRIALDAALAQPARVQALVLVAPAVSGAPPLPPGAAERALEDAIAAADATGDVAAVNELEAQLWLDGPGSARGRVGGAARELFMSMNGIALQAPDPGPETPPASAWDNLHTLRVPTSVLWGDLDTPRVQQRCEQLVPRIANARRLRMPGVAHLPSLEAPARFNAALRTELAAL